MKIKGFSFLRTSSGIQEVYRELNQQRPFITICDSICGDQKHLGKCAASTHAAELAERAIADYLSSHTSSTLTEAILAEAFEHANQELLPTFEMTEENFAVSALIITAAHASGHANDDSSAHKQLLIGGLGDLRVYQAGPQGCQIAFRDPSFPEAPASWNPSNRFQKLQNTLGCTLGEKHTLQPRFQKTNLSSQERLIIASYGLYEQTAPKEIQELAQRPHDPDYGIARRLTAKEDHGHPLKACVLSMDSFVATHPSGEAQLHDAEGSHLQLGRKRRRYTALALSITTCAFLVTLGSFMLFKEDAKGEAKGAGLAATIEASKAAAAIPQATATAAQLQGIESVLKALQEQNRLQTDNIVVLKQKLRGQENELQALEEQKPVATRLKSKRAELPIPVSAGNFDINKEESKETAAGSAKDNAAGTVSAVDHQKAIGQLGQLTAAIESKNSELKSLIDEKEKAAQSLQQQIAAQQSELNKQKNQLEFFASLAEEKAHLQARVAELSTAINHQAAAISQEVEERSGLADTAELLRQRLADEATLRENLNKTLTNEQTLRETKENALQGAKQQLAAQQQLLSEQKEQLTALATSAEEKTQLQSKIAGLTAALHQQGSIVSDAMDERTKLAAAADQINQELTKEIALRGKIGEEKAHLEVKMNELAAALERQTSVFSTTEEEKSKLAAKLSQLNQELAEETTSREKTATEIARLQEHVSDLTATLEQQSEDGSKASEEKSKLAATVDQLNQKIADETALREKIDQIFTEEQALRERKETEVQRLEKHLQTLEATIEDKAQAERASVARSKELADKQSELAKANEDLQTQLAAATKKQDEEQSTKQEALRKVSVLTAMVETQKKALQASEKGRQSLAAEVNKHKKEPVAMASQSRNSNQMSSQANSQAASRPADKSVAAAPKIAPQNLIASLDEPSEQPQSTRHVISRGDTLTGISQKYYGTSKKWRDIYDANRDSIPNQNRIKAGITLVIP